MDSDPNWLKEFDDFVEAKNTNRGRVVSKDGWINYANWIEDKLEKIQAGFWDLAKNVLTNHIFLTRIKNSEDLEREKPQTSKESWDETKLLEYSNEFSRMDPLFRQYQMLIWEQIDTRLKIGMLDPDMDATEDVGELHKEHDKIVAFMNQWKAKVEEVKKIENPTTYQIQSVYLDLWLNYLPDFFPPGSPNAT